MRKKTLVVIVCMLMVGTIFSASGNIVIKNDNNPASNCDIYGNDVEWITQLVDSEGDVGLYSDLIADNINQFLSYYDKTNGDLKYAVWDGEVWDIQVVDSVGDVGMYSSLAFSFISPCISYYDNTNHDLKYTYWTPIDEAGNGYWVSETVDSTGDVGQGSSLSFSTGWNGDIYFSIPHISYYDATNNKLKYAFKDFNDQKWYIETIDDGGLYNDMALFDSEGINKGIAYTGANGGLKYCYYYCCPDGGCWWIDEVVDSSGEGWDVSIASDNNGQPHISYYKDGKLYYTWRSGSSFTTPVVVDNVIYGGWRSSIATYDNDAYISYYKYDTRDLYYRKMSESSGIPLLTEGDVGQHSSIFVYDGLVHVSCYDNTNDDLIKVFQQQEDPFPPVSILDVSEPYCFGDTAELGEHRIVSRDTLFAIMGDDDTCKYTCEIGGMLCWHNHGNTPLYITIPKEVTRKEVPPLGIDWEGEVNIAMDYYKYLDIKVYKSADEEDQDELCWRVFGCKSLVNEAENKNYDVKHRPDDEYYFYISKYLKSNSIDDQIETFDKEQLYLDNFRVKKKECEEQNSYISSGVEFTRYRTWYLGAWSEWFKYEEPFSLPNLGTYFLEYYSVDFAGNYEEIKNATIVVEDIHSPDKPNRPDGITSGKIHQEYTYTASTTDLDGDQIFYVFNWGDGTMSGWLGPYDSGESCEASYMWKEKGDYTIQVRAKDERQCCTDWSDPLTITMPRNRRIDTPFMNILQKLPLIYQILQQYLKL